MRQLCLIVATVLLSAGLGPLDGQSSRTPLPYWADADPSKHLPQDLGASGLYQALLGLSTTASLMHTTAHPDDEHSAMLTLMSRGRGVRTSLLTLNRGEGGANAIGSELFDALGVIRTEELLLSGRYYGLAQQYFTTAIDYGFSKTLDEALRSWGRDAVLEDMVRIIRLERPIVVVSRFHGSERDGHGHHQAAGGLTPAAVEAAADPERFSSQIREEGLRPWAVKRVYRGGIRDGEARDLEIDANAHSPSLGTSYDGFGALGISLQRSQTSGRMRSTSGRVTYAYEQLAGQPLPSSSTGFFDGLDTSFVGVFELTGEAPSPAARESLAAAEVHLSDALESLGPADMGVVVPHLTAALTALRRARAASSGRPDARLIIQRKIVEAENALRLATGTSLRATVVAVNGGTSGSAFRLAPGDLVDVEVELATSDPAVARAAAIALDTPAGWEVSQGAGDMDAGRERSFRSASFQLRVPASAEPSRPYFSRSSLREDRYAIRDSVPLHLPWGPPEVIARARVGSPGDPTGFDVRTVLRGEESDPPRGAVRREIRVVSPVSVAITPTVRVVPRSAGFASLGFAVDVTQEAGRPTSGEVALTATRGWEVTPQSMPFALRRPGETMRLDFEVQPELLDGLRAAVAAVAVVDGRVYAESERIIRHPDLEVRSLRAPAEATITPLDVEMVAGLAIGYVMGVGDEMPVAIRELGAEVELLDASALAGQNLARYDAIVLGTRAYAVRPELFALNERLLAYANGGGHIIILYQTQEYAAAELAPHQAVLPDRAEEVSEQDAEVVLLAPDHPLLVSPNRITSEDFDDWIEQRGSKFFSEWGEEFTPLVETHDEGQDPQRGVWLTTPHGDGHYTYVALALHRQTPYGVPGAYRILANLLSYGRSN